MVFFGSSTLARNNSFRSGLFANISPRTFSLFFCPELEQSSILVVWIPSPYSQIQPNTQVYNLCLAVGLPTKYHPRNTKHGPPINRPCSFSIVPMVHSLPSVKAKTWLQPFRLSHEEFLHLSTFLSVLCAFDSAYAPSIINQRHYLHNTLNIRYNGLIYMKLTISLLAVADIGSGSSCVGPFSPTKCKLQI